MLPSITSNTSCGAFVSAFWMTRWIFFSSSIRCNWVGKRPAVSINTTSRPRALPAVTASKLTAAGSPWSWLMMSTWLRSAHTNNCSLAAARKVSAAANKTLCPASLKWRVSLPMVVVFPAPFTPATMTTVGLFTSSDHSPCKGSSTSVSTSVSNSLTCAGWVLPLALTRNFKACKTACVAGIPASAINSADSSSSNSASSMTLPPNTPAMLLPVRCKLLRKRPNHVWAATCEADGP